MNKGVLAGLGPGDGPDVLSGDAGQNAVLVAGGRKEFPFSFTAAGNSQAIDCSGYRSVSIQVVAITTQTITFQQSNDGINWQNLPLMSMLYTGTGNPPLVNSTTAVSMYAGPIFARYFRLNITSAGSCSGVVDLLTLPVVSNTVAAYLPGTSLVTMSATLAPAGDAAASVAGFVSAFGSGYNGANWDRLRTPNKFNTATATASGDTAVWTPTAGKKFRLMRYQIQITGDVSLAAAADLDIVLRDSTTAIGVGYSLYVPAASVAALGSDNSGWIDLGNGYLSTTINQVLNVNLSAALTSGKVRVVTAGVEE